MIRGVCQWRPSENDVFRLRLSPTIRKSMRMAHPPPISRNAGPLCLSVRGKTRAQRSICGPRSLVKSGYSYASPEPQGFKYKHVRPDAAFYDQQLGEFLLMYDEVRKAESPTALLLEFCQSTYEAAATLGSWDRPALER